MSREFNWHVQHMGGVRVRIDLSVLIGWPILAPTVVRINALEGRLN